MPFSNSPSFATSDNEQDSAISLDSALENVKSQSNGKSWIEGPLDSVERYKIPEAEPLEGNIGPKTNGKLTES